MKVVLFGAGETTIKFLEMKAFLHYDIQAVVDNDKKKHGLEISVKGRRLKISSPKNILSYDFDMIIIAVANLGYQLDIKRQLTNLGVPVGKIKIYRTAQIKEIPEIMDKMADNNENHIFIDTTNITRDDDKTGIQRVVRELYKNMVEQTRNIFPIQSINNSWITSREFESRIRNAMFDNKEYVVKVNNGTVFLPDIAWDIPNLFKSLTHNDNICTVVYDLIPVYYPQEVSEKYRKQFIEWIDGVIQYSSKCICISKSVADDVVIYFKRKKIQRCIPLKIYTMNLGFDIPKAHEKVRDKLYQFVHNSVTFLMVGTVNPRKNHALLLASIKKVCKQIPEKKIQLLILGRGGWMSKSFERMYLNDKSIQKNVLWIKDASDSEVQWAYQNCTALVYPPKTEGFGLPLVEAAHFRLPILCSDIPIFHEVVGDNADYFKVDDVDSLTEALIRWIRTDKHPDSGKIKMHTWKACAEEVLDILNDRAEPYAVLS